MDVTAVTGTANALVCEKLEQQVVLVRVIEELCQATANQCEASPRCPWTAGVRKGIRRIHS